MSGKNHLYPRKIKVKSQKLMKALKQCRTGAEKSDDDEATEWQCGISSVQSVLLRFCNVLPDISVTL